MSEAGSLGAAGAGVSLRARSASCVALPSHALDASPGAGVEEVPAKVETATRSGDAGVVFETSVATVAFGGVEGAPLELGAICHGFRSAPAELSSSEKFEAATLRARRNDVSTERGSSGRNINVHSPSGSLAR